MLAFLGLALLLSLTVVFPGRNCSNIQRRYSNVEEANDYVDRIIQETIEEHRHKLEPYHPKPANFTFERKHLFVTIHGEVSLHNMVITGLTTIHREGDCQRTTTDGISKLSANLGMGIIQFDSDATVKVMGIGPTVKISGEIGYSMIHLEASRDVDGESLAKIDKLEIYDLKGTDLKVSGFKLRLIDKFVSVITEGVVKLFKRKIMKGIEEKLKESLEEKIKDSVFPID